MFDTVQETMEEEMIKSKTNATWNKVTDCLPVLNDSEEIYGTLRSQTVLAYCPSGYKVAYLQKWDDQDDFNWIESGRDSYILDDVEYWRFLPMKP